jgi:GTPase SAR1 family protein/Leucine-rich repeat (LRR) protein
LKIVKEEEEKEKEEKSPFFNPINVNSYSKFGRTCLHEAIRNGHIKLVQLLIQHGADVNLPIYEATSKRDPETERSSTQKVIISNCLCEALEKCSEKMVRLLVDHIQFNDQMFDLAYKKCQELGYYKPDESSQTTTKSNQQLTEEERKSKEAADLMNAAEASIFFHKNMLAYLMQLKLLNDTENKVNIINRQKVNLIPTSKSMVTGLAISTQSQTSQQQQQQNTDGLILNWNDMEPKLSQIYESWLLMSSKHFKFKKKEDTNNDDNNDSSPLHKSAKKLPTSIMRKLHQQVITRIDLSNNWLTDLPLALFQLESLKILRLSKNFIRKLPIEKHTLFDDVNISLPLMSGYFDSMMSWSCHNLEELDIDGNQLIELIPCLFKIRSLKHLNASSNQIKLLPCEMWSAPSLIHLNLSFNLLSELPFLSTKCCSNNILQSMSRRSARTDTRRSTIDSTSKQMNQPTASSLNNTNNFKKEAKNKDDLMLIQTCVNYEEKTLIKANFWQNSSNTNSIGLMTPIDNTTSLTYNNKNDTNINQSDNKKEKFKFNEFSNETGSESVSKLFDLNLSNNKFTRVPASLSCLATKLAKLNLSNNSIRAMGSICDLPSSLKFLDLSNNKIKLPMRILNAYLLKIISLYFSKVTQSSRSIVAPTSSLDTMNTELAKTFVNNQFCHFYALKASLTKDRTSYVTKRDHKQQEQERQQQPVIMQRNQQEFLSRLNLRSKTRGPDIDSTSHFKRSDEIQIDNKSIKQRQGAAQQRISNNRMKSAVNSKQKRARSQSRNQHNRIASTTLNQVVQTIDMMMIPPNTDATTATTTTTQMKREEQKTRLIPFDLFMVNTRYDLMTMTNIETSKNEIVKMNEQQELAEDVELYLNEKQFVNNINLPIFMEELCPHKRHIKLENLKSLNLSNNKLKHCYLMLDLVEISETNETTSTPQHLPSYDQMNNLTKGYFNESDNENDERSELLSDDDSFSSSDEYILRHMSEECGPVKQSNQRSKTRFRDKFFSKVKSSPTTTTPKNKKDHYNSYHNHQERAKNTSQLMYPNLTHLDLSSNRLRRLPGMLSLLENLSYLSAMSNKRLTRISPRIGLLTKLWNFDLKNCENLREPNMIDILVQQKTKSSDILGFLKSILERSRPYTRMKLMFVGVQAIGKTSLLNRLKEESHGHSNESSNHNKSWTDRVSSSPASASTLSGGSSTTSTNTSKSTNISTVGIDINEWVYEKPVLSSSTSRKLSTPAALYGLTPIPNVVYPIETCNTLNNQSFGPITFRTWDFGGQREYYSTHQYFISKRAIYLVCWKLSEEEKGINEIHQWLSNIQTRAPGSPVIIIGTHQDQLAKLKNYKEISSYLQKLIFDRFVRPSGESETSSSAYPPIMASIEISSKTGHNIKALGRLIYDVAGQMKLSGFKDQLLLEQKVPVTYLALEQCISFILQRLKQHSRNPVLNTVDYVKEVQDAMETLYPDPDTVNKNDDKIQINGFSTTELMRNLLGSSSSSQSNNTILIRFRDEAEVLQATQFLHENGIIIHYNDVAMRDLFFLDPQWLCDVLATVVTIREINPFAAKGIMKISDLLVLFKGSRFPESEDIMSFIVDLLGKFELALTWDNEHLLIPALLPSETMLKFANQDIRIPIVSKQKTMADRLNLISYHNLLNYPQTVKPDQRQLTSTPLSKTNFSNDKRQTTMSKEESQISSLYCNVKLVNSYSQMTLAKKMNIEFQYECRPYNPQSANEVNSN